MDKGRATVAFKLMPLAGRGNVSLFYADIIGINRQSARTPGKRELLLELANLMASTEVMVDSIGPDPGSNDPQYLMPVRNSVFEQLGYNFPLYRQLHEMVLDSEPAGLFRINATSRDWLGNMKATIQQQIYNAQSCN